MLMTRRVSPTRVVDREPRHAHVHAVAAERDSLRHQQLALTLALGDLFVGSDHPVPRDVRVEPPDAITAPANRGASGHRSP